VAFCALLIEMGWEKAWDETSKLPFSHHEEKVLVFFSWRGRGWFQCEVGIGVASHTQTLTRWGGEFDLVVDIGDLGCCLGEREHGHGLDAAPR